MVNASPRSLYTRKRDPVAIVQESGWAPGPVWTGKESLAPTGIRSPDRPARSEASVLQKSFINSPLYWNCKHLFFPSLSVDPTEFSEYVLVCSLRLFSYHRQLSSGSNVTDWLTDWLTSPWPRPHSRRDVPVTQLSCVAWTAWPLRMGRISSPETSVSNHFTLRNNPEDWRCQFSCGESLRSLKHGVVPMLNEHAKTDRGM